MFEGIGAELVWDGGSEINIPEKMGAPRPGQMEGTSAERLTELAGRVCYDSMGSKQSRNSAEYIEHILQVGHYSIAEHYNVTLLIESHSASFQHILSAVMLNRPGTWTELTLHGGRVTLNCRTAMEFDRWTKVLAENWSDYPVHLAAQVGALIRDRFHELAPRLVKKPHPAETSAAGTQLQIKTVMEVEPRSDAERWITIYTYGSRGFCYDSDTEVLTEDGWIRWPEIVGSEKFATLNMKTEELEYQEASAVVHEPYHGEMVRIVSQCVDLLVTPNHRMVIRKHDTRAAGRGEEPLDILRAGDLGGRRVKFKRTANWTGEAPETFAIPDVVVEAPVSNQTGPCGTRTVVCSGREVRALPFARMIGWWLAEGSLDHTPGSGYSVVISQSENSPHWEDLTRCVEEAGFTYSINRSSTCPQMRINGGRALYDFLSPFRGAASKAVPDDIKKWGPAYQRELILGFLAGDGSRSSDNHAGEGHTISRQLADDLQEAALKAGWSATIRISDRTGQSGGTVNGVEITHRHPVYVVGFGRKRGSEPLINHGGKRHESREHYSGMIHCVTVPNGTLYVRRNGKPCWSGNSHELVRHGDYTAISQRSTRYCEESESPWTIHPLIQGYLKDEKNALAVNRAHGQQLVNDTIAKCRHAYKWWVDVLVPYVADRIKDDPYAKTTARKQARGAARGFLGNALETEIVFSANIMQWRHILRMRAAQAADGEIRVAACAALGAIKKSRYGDRLSDLELVEAGDGTGLMLSDGGAA